MSTAITIKVDCTVAGGPAQAAFEVTRTVGYPFQNNLNVLITDADDDSTILADLVFNASDIKELARRLDQMETMFN